MMTAFGTPVLRDLRFGPLAEPLLKSLDLIVKLVHHGFRIVVIHERAEPSVEHGAHNADGKSQKNGGCSLSHDLFVPNLRNTKARPWSELQDRALWSDFD